MNKTYLAIGIVAVVILVILIARPVSFGGKVENIFTHFIRGIQIGSTEEAGCIKFMDTDKGGWTYLTYLNGVSTVTGGAATAFTMPPACAGK